MLPVLTFIGSYFLFHLFDWMEATQFILAVLVSLLTYFMMVADFKAEYKEKMDLSKLNFFTGLLTILFIMIFLHGFLHWYRMIAFNHRMILLFALLLIYITILFRAIRTLTLLKSMAQNK